MYGADKIIEGQLADDEDITDDFKSCHFKQQAA